MFTFKSNARVVLLLTVLMVGFVMAGPAQSQDTVLINYQGYLTDADGNPLTGSYTQAFKVRAWWDPDDQVLWGETHPSVPVNNGFFSVILGSYTPLPASIFNGENRYLFVSIDGDEEMDPPTLLTSAPAAVVSKRVAGDIRTEAGKIEVTNSNVYPGLINLEVSDDDAGLDIFANAEPFEMAGNFQITAGPDEAGLLASHGPHSATHGVELIATADSNAVRIHSPDPGSAETLIQAGIQEMDFSTIVDVPSDDEVTPISLRSRWSPDSTYGMLKIVAVAGGGDDYWEESPWNVTVNRDSTFMVFSRTDPFGETSPMVEFVATSSSGTLTLTGEDATGEQPQIAMVAGSDGASVAIGTDTPTEALTVMGNGWFSGDIYTMTDTRVKTNIRPVDGALDKIDALNGYYYDCRTEEFPEYRMPKTPQIGLLAQEVSQVVPEVVRNNDQGIAGVSYSRLTALLVEAVKELKAENEDLRARITELESR